MPEKSTFPSGVRGAGASRIGLPSAVRGTPGVGYDGHCALNEADMAARTAITPAVILIRQVTTYYLLILVGGISVAEPER